MPRFRLALVVFCLLVGATLTAMPADAGPQDFVLVNRTGTTIYQLHFSPTSTDNWEEDVLGQNVLYDGHNIRTRVQNYNECYWDIMAVDEAGYGIYWYEIDLCSIWEVTLRCNAETCWATFK